MYNPKKNLKARLMYYHNMAWYRVFSIWYVIASVSVILYIHSKYLHVA
jgi:hypothetical protein